MRTICAAATIGLVLPSLLTGCGGGGTTQPPPQTGDSLTPPAGSWRAVTPQATTVVRKKWTFLVYMNAANDLEPFSGLNLNQMEQVGSSADVNIVVQAKRFNPANTSEQVDRTTRLFYVTRDSNNDQVTSPVLYQNDSLDMGKAQTLREFVNWGVQNFPAERYCLVVWNHGSGWRSHRLVKGERITRGVSYDDLTGSHIDTAELPAAIQLPNGAKWDLLAWDSSLMQMAEVAYQIKDQAQYIVGSEESPPGEGYPYDAFLRRLVQNPGLDGKSLGTFVAQDTLANFGNSSDTTQSLLDPEKLPQVAAAVNELGDALLGVASQYGTQIRQARDLTESYGGGESAYPNYDLVDFAQQLTSTASGSTPLVPDARVQAASAAVQQAVAGAVLVNVHGQGHPRSNGLAIFIPSATQYRNIDRDQADGSGTFYGARYSDLGFSQAAPRWQSFLAQGPQ